MPKPFRYQRVASFDHLRPIWYVSRERDGAYLGMISGEAANNFTVRRPQDNSFHSPCGSRREAARWLRDQSTDPAVFDEDEEDEDDEGSN